MVKEAIRILLVDDNPDFLDFAARYLGGVGGMEVAGAAMSGEEAVSLSARLRPDLVLLDLAMPGMGGLEAAARIKGDPAPPKVVILTMYDDPVYHEAARQAGADGFVTKAEMDSRLVGVIRELFGEEKRMKNILVVDDSPTMRKMVMASLRGLGGAVFREASSGLEAVEQMAINPVDLMVLDLNMPDMHGLEVLRFMHSHERYRRIPVVVLTTRGDDLSREEALGAGAARYMTKPFQPAELAKTVAELLTGKGGADEPSRR